MTKLQMIDALRLHIKEIDREIGEMPDLDLKVELIKEKGETLRALKDLIN